jgi:alkylhydroperoxidase family enzyme
MNLLLFVVAAVLPVAGPSTRFPAAAPDAAWALLPREDPPLPAWARVLVKTHPRTTGAMLEIDRLHRADNPLGAVLAAKLRWAAADALGSEYGRATALADLKRAGAPADEVRRLTEDRPSDGERRLLALARQLTTAAYLVTDEQFAAVLDQLGPEKMVAAVHTVAFANFENRVTMALGVKVEAGGPVPPLSVKLDRERRAVVKAPPRPAWDAVTSARPKKEYDAPPDWKEVPYEQLEERLATQKERTPRVPIPDRSKFEKFPPAARRQAETILWNTISDGYQPEMTDAWFGMLAEYRADSRTDRVFGSTLFWVVTRANDCFY